MNQLASIPRLHSTNPAQRNYDVFHVHGSRNYEQRGPVVQYFPGPNMTKKMHVTECGHGLRTNHLDGNPRSSCNKNPGCFLPRK